MVEERKQANSQLSEVEELRLQNINLNKQLESMTNFLQSYQVNDIEQLQSLKGHIEAKDARIAVLERLYRKVTTREAKKDALTEVTQQNEERLRSLEASLTPQVLCYNES